MYFGEKAVDKVLITYIYRPVEKSVSKKEWKNAFQILSILIG